MKHLRGSLAALLLVLGLGATADRPAVAHSYKLGAISIGHVWAPPLESGADALPVYGPIFNQGTMVAHLVGASTPAAKEVRFRQAVDGKATWLAEIAFVPGKPLALAPWRVHLWLSGLTRGFGEGDSFPLTLDFGPAGKKTVEVVVETAAGH